MITIGQAVLIGLLSSAASLGGFYALTNFRLKKLEDHNDNNGDIRERLIRIETILRDKL